MPTTVHKKTLWRKLPENGDIILLKKYSDINDKLSPPKFISMCGSGPMSNPVILIALPEIQNQIAPCN